MDRILEILALLANPEALENDQLAALETELHGLFDQVRAGEVEAPEDSSTVQVLRDIVEACQNIGALAHERIEAATAEQNEIDELASQLHPVAAGEGDGEGDEPEGGEGDQPGEGDEPAAGEGDTPEGGEATGDQPTDESAAGDTPAEPELVTAAAGTVPLGQATRRQAARTRPRPPAPSERDPRVTVVRTDGGAITYDQAGEVMSQRFGELGPNAGKRTLVQFKAQWPESHMLREADTAENGRKLDAIMAAAQEPDAWSDAQVAAGGWCSPSEVDYGLIVQAVADRPMKGALPNIGMERGGIRVPVSPTLSVIDTAPDVTTSDGAEAIAIWTEANDIAALDNDGGEGDLVKPVQRIDCPTWVEFREYAIVKRLRFGNMASRANPEHVRAWNDLAMAAYARVAETRILDLIKGDAGTTELVQPTATLGAARDLLELVIRLGEFMRSSERTGAQARLRVPLPAWIIGLMQADLIRTSRSDDVVDLLVARNTIVQMLGNANITPTFYLDSPSSGPSQLLARQTDAGAPRAWPCDVQFGLWFEGHFAHGDAGELNLGVWRDRDLNDVNDYETFAEGFEGVVARRGPEALWVTQRLVPDGTYSAPVEVTIDCATG